jgi:hypothetical protein
MSFMAGPPLRVKVLPVMTRRSMGGVPSLPWALWARIHIDERVVSDGDVARDAADGADAGVQTDGVAHADEGEVLQYSGAGHDAESLKVIFKVAISDHPARTLVIEPFGLPLCKGRGVLVQRDHKIFVGC